MHVYLQAVELFFGYDTTDLVMKCSLWDHNEHAKVDPLSLSLIKKSNATVEDYGVFHCRITFFHWKYCCLYLYIIKENHDYLTYQHIAQTTEQIEL